MKVIALKVKDATSAWKETTKRGGKSYMEPKTLKDEHGKIVMSGIHTYGDVVHVFVERDDYTGPFMPGLRNGSRSFRRDGNRICSMSIIASATSVGTR